MFESFLEAFFFASVPDDSVLFIAEVSIRFARAIDTLVVTPVLNVVNFVINVKLCLAPLGESFFFSACSSPGCFYHDLVLDWAEVKNRIRCTRMHESFGPALAFVCCMVAATRCSACFHVATPLLFFSLFIRLD